MSTTSRTASGQDRDPDRRMPAARVDDPRRLLPLPALGVLSLVALPSCDAAEREPEALQAGDHADARGMEMTLQVESPS